MRKLAEVGLGSASQLKRRQERPKSRFTTPEGGPTVLRGRSRSSGILHIIAEFMVGLPSIRPTGDSYGCDSAFMTLLPHARP
jgi:hypothetical protein